MNSHRFRQFHKRLIPLTLKSFYTTLKPNSLELLKITTGYSFVSARRTLHFTSSMPLRTETKAMSGEGDQKNLTVSYEDIVKAQNDSNILIIDVREDEEINETGKLPGSIHMPMGNVITAFTILPNERFKETYNVERPRKTMKIIVSCRSGRRSAMVQSELQRLGFENVYNYTGGWLDWESNQKA